jgi:hypothetical protein
MPVTAKLSRKFYDALGDDVANELVEWFNQVDLTYRTELRELNEQNFARFDAKLEQRLAALRAELGTRIDRLDAKFEQRLAELSVRIDRLDAKLDARIDGVVADLHAVLERRLAEQTRWFFVAWASLLVPIIGLWFRG